MPANESPALTPTGTHRVRVLPLQREFHCSGQSTVLQAAELAGVALPSSCRNGTCRTCLCRIQHGQVDYLVEWPGLSAEEKAEGWTLPCVALPRTDLVIEQPGAAAV